MYGQESYARLTVLYNFQSSKIAQTVQSAENVPDRALSSLSVCFSFQRPL